MMMLNIWVALTNIVEIPLSQFVILTEVIIQLELLMLKLQILPNYVRINLVEHIVMKDWLPMIIVPVKINLKFPLMILLIVIGVQMKHLECGIFLM